MLVLGIETSCDEASAAVVEDGYQILSNIISSQDSFHQKFGGIVPEIAARQHTHVINFVIDEAVGEAGITLKNIDAIAVTNNHGLIRSLVVGVAAAKSLSLALNKPLIGVHHIEGHIYSNLIEHHGQLTFPFLCLTVSGGHTLLIYVQDHGKYSLIGRTLDDAAGEAYDKIAKELGLGFPGGPVVDRLAKEGNPAAFNFPRPMLNAENYDFSFSGLKTAVVNEIKALSNAGKQLPVKDICASFQQAVIDVLVTKSLRAAASWQVNHIALAGGVAANSLMRQTLKERAKEKGLNVFYPHLSLCTDNGAMIAGAAYHKWITGYKWDNYLDAHASAPLGLFEIDYKR